MTVNQDSTLSRCPNCDRSVRGRYCANCGATTESAQCVACDSALEPGDRHCSQCGTAVAGAAGGARMAAGQRTGWIVAGIAFVALALMVVLQKASERRAADAAAVTDVAATQTSAPAPGGGSRLSAQDIAAMPPREQMDRLFDRIMRLKEEGKADSVRFFAPMVMGLYERPDLQPLDADLRYDMGTVANAAGMFDVEKAQSDTVLASAPDHLLGLLMAARNARSRGRADEAKRFDKRLLDAEAKETAKQLPEYLRHKNEIDDGLKTAKGS